MSSENSKRSEKTTKAAPKDFEKPKRIHPCDLIELNKMAELLELDVNQMRARRERKGNDICIVSTTEIGQKGKEQDIFFFNLLINSNGKADYKKGISEMLAEGTLLIPAGPDEGKYMPLKQVEGLGGEAFVYSAAHFTALIFEKNNQYRYTMTLYKNVANSDIFNGLDQDSGELEEALIELAKSM